MESIDGWLPSSVLGSDRRFQNSSFGIQNALIQAMDSRYPLLRAQESISVNESRYLSSEKR